MQPRILVAALIFLASYFPLAMILALQDLDLATLRQPICWDLRALRESCAVPLKHPGMSIAPVIICLLCLCVTLLALTKIQTRTQILIRSAKHVPADLMNYTLPYIVTFMSLDYGDPEKLSGFLGFLIWIFVITLRSGQLLMNPVLTVFGWQLYELSFSYVGGSTKEHTGVALVTGELGPEMAVGHQMILVRANLRGHPHGDLQDAGLLRGQQMLRRENVLNPRPVG